MNITKFLIITLSLISNVTIAQSFPSVVEDLPPATAYLSPNSTMDAWYRIML